MRLLIALFLSSALMAGQPWSTQDKVLEAGFIGATALDWGQTLDIENHPNLHEGNRILGPHPSRSAINTYFVGSILFHAAVADQLSGRWRTAWQATWIGLELGTVERNLRLGIRLNF